MPETLSAGSHCMGIPLESLRSHVYGGLPGTWHWSQRANEEESCNGVEAWVYALRGEYRHWSLLRAEDLSGCDLIILNMNQEALPHYRGVLGAAANRTAKIVGLYEGELALMHDSWKQWKEVADMCDIVIGINAHGIGFLQSITSVPVHYVGIPYPADGVRKYHIPPENRRREIFLCAFLLARPLNYLAARQMGLPMVGYERTFFRRIRELIRHRSLDKLRYVRRAQELYNDSLLTVLPEENLQGFFRRASQSLIWMNLDPRYTWGRYVLDAAALGIPIITTNETGHATHLFPDTVVETPFDIEGAGLMARRLLDEPHFYAGVVARAWRGLDWYRPESTLARLDEALAGIQEP